MNKKKFTKMIIAVFISCLVVLVGMEVYNKLNVEVSNSVYDLYNRNIPKKEKKLATNAIKKTKKTLLEFQNYSPEINFNNMYTDSVLAGAAKKDYLDKLNNNVNKKYFDILKKNLKYDVVHIHKGVYPKSRSKNIRFVLNISVKYVDLEKNYKIYKNKQLLGSVGPNVDFVTYLSDEKNIQLSQTFITDYYVDYIAETKKYMLKAPDMVTFYMFQVKNINQNIDDMISQIVYDISNQPKDEDKEKFELAKKKMDEELEIVRSKDIEKTIEWIKNNANLSQVEKIKMIEYADKFKIQFAKTDLVKFLLDTNEYEFIGYNNKKNTVVYSINGYNYDELSKMFITNEVDNMIDHRLNYSKYLVFKEALKNNEFVKEIRFIEIPVNKAGEASPLLPYIMPNEKNMWSYDQVEYQGLQGIDVNKVPQDFNKYFSVTSVDNFASRAAVVYISKDAYAEEFEKTGTWDAYNKDCEKLIIDSLKIILGYEENANNTVYVEDFNKLVQTILQRMNSTSQEISEIVDPKKCNLNGVTIKLNISGNSFAMAVKVDKWEIKE